MEMPPWRYEPALDLGHPFLERLRRFPREPEMLVHAVRSTAALAIRGWLRFYHRFTIVGRENLPEDQSFVVVANHASHLDPLCLLSSLPLGQLHRAHPAAARDYFFVGVPGLLAAVVIANALPFDRGTDLRESLDLCRGALDEPGTVVVIFPEGTRSVNGEVGEFKAGIGLLAAGSRYPVVPCHLEGSHAALPKGRWLPRPRRIRLTIGAPRVYSHLEPTASSAHRIGRELRQAVLDLVPTAPPHQIPSLGSRIRLAPRQEIAV